jgi:hypothetical protein
MERIALAREYRVAEWLRDAYLEVTQQPPLDFDALRPAEPYFESDSVDRDWEAYAKKWEAVSRDWETLAKISQLQTKVATSITAIPSYTHCYECRMNYGAPYKCLCKCRLSALAEEAFREELKSLEENPKKAKNLPRRKLPLSYLCPMKAIFL